MDPTARSSRRVAWMLSTVLALALAIPAVAEAARHGRRFPVPTCRWASAALIHKTLGLQVRALKPSWRTQIAPVLTCAYVERQPSLQFGDVPIVTIEFRELQHFRAPASWTRVRGLGRCIARSSCPRGGGTAYEQIIQSWNPTANGSGSGSGSTGGTTTGTGPGTTSGSGSGGSTGTGPGGSTGTGGPSGSGSGTTPSGAPSDASSTTPTAFVSAATLSVEDGLNMIAIRVRNPYGPLPIVSVQYALRQLSRALLPRFYWR